MWWKTNSDILVKFVETRGIDDEHARTVLGLALLALGGSESDGDSLFRLTDLLEATSATLDTPLLLEVLETASAAQTAGILWSPLGLHLSAAHFERLYRRVLDASPPESVLYELVGGAVDFLRLHPGAFPLSFEMVSRLLQSSHVDARVVAMKALFYCQVSPGYYVDCILRCLQSSADSEIEIGLYQLGELFDREGSRLLETLDSDRMRQLHRMLDELAGDRNETRRICAAVHRNALAEWGRNHGLSDERADSHRT